MKNLLFIFVFFGIFNAQMNAQVDVKINPISLLRNGVDISAEYGLQPTFGLDATASYDYGNIKIGDQEFGVKGPGLILMGKYYFNPKTTLDNWHVALFTKVKGGNYKYNEEITNRRSFSIGFYSGYKLVSQNNVVFEIGAGLGRYAVNTLGPENANLDFSKIPFLNLDFIAKVAVGYRF